MKAAHQLMKLALPSKKRIFPRRSPDFRMSSDKSYQLMQNSFAILAALANTNIHHR
jgi:hypothetical protein